MADLLGSILGSMEKPPSMGDEEKKKAREQKKRADILRQREKDLLNKFKTQVQKRINEFIKDNTKEKYKLEVMDKVHRSVVHEVADVAGLTSFSFGEEEVDRYIIVWKKEFAPVDDELSAIRKGEEWDPEKAEEAARLKELSKQEEEKRLRERCSEVTPATNYRDKYEKLIGRDSAKDAAKITSANKAYGFVPSENKRDLRTIEQVMADNKAKKKQKTDHMDNMGTVSANWEPVSQATTDVAKLHGGDADT